MSLELVKTILEIIGLLCVPIIAWLLNTVNNHSRKIIILEERVNDSLNRRLTGLETKFQSFEEKLENIKINSVRVAQLVESLGEKIDGIKSR